MHERQCRISGQWPVTVHHVRTNGSPKNDYHTLPLIALYHQIQADPKQTESIEALGKVKWERRHGVDIWATVAHYNKWYEADTGRSITQKATVAGDHEGGAVAVLPGQAD